MEPIRILAIGRNEPIMEVVLRLINQHAGWIGESANSAEGAVLRLQEQGYDVLLLCAGIDVEEEAVLKAAVGKMESAPLVIRHFGGGSGLLENEILQALNGGK